MHLLYLDESGNPDDPADRHFILAGLSAFEKNTHFLSTEADSIQAKHFPGSPPVDFHAQHVRSGRGFWRNQERATREQVLRDLASILARSYGSVRLFGAVVEKTAHLHGEDVVKAATEQVCKRFDLVLKRRLREHNDEQRGLVVFAESHYQSRAKVGVKGFRELGTQWGLLHSLCDIPYFAPARESRVLQLADYVAHATQLWCATSFGSSITPMAFCTASSTSRRTKAPDVTALPVSVAAVLTNSGVGSLKQIVSLTSAVIPSCYRPASWARTLRCCTSTAGAAMAGRSTSHLESRVLQMR